MTKTHIPNLCLKCHEALLINCNFVQAPKQSSLLITQIRELLTSFPPICRHSAPHHLAVTVLSAPI